MVLCSKEFYCPIQKWMDLCSTEIVLSGTEMDVFSKEFAAQRSVLTLPRSVLGAPSQRLCRARCSDGARRSVLTLPRSVIGFAVQCSVLTLLCSESALCSFTVLTCILPRDTVLAFSSELRYGAHFLLRTAIQRSDIVLLPPWHPHVKWHPITVARFSG